MGSEKTATTAFEMDLGTNLIRGCEAVLEIVDSQGKVQSFFGLEDDGGNLLFSCTLTDKTGRTVAKVRRNSVVYWDQDLLEAFHDHGRGKGRKITLQARTSEGPSLSVLFTEDRALKVRGRFFAGTWVIEATDAHLNLGGLILVENSLSGGATAIRIREGQMAIGGGRAAQKD